ncbi:MAG: Asp-tRNA(Asn)/Glu-tRNA(Gln) amidotransferase subunit GatC [Candidatus Dormibacteria bacterium]
MPLAAGDVEHVATLARLGLSEEEKARFGAQLDAILAHVGALQDIDTSAVPETARVGTLVNVWREDVAEPSLSAAAALANAPERDGDHFTVGAIQE